MKNQIDIHLLARINKAVLQYYARAEPYKTQENFEIWLRGLITAVRIHFEEQGFQKHKNAFPFMRFVLELNDIGMDEFMRSNLSPNDFIGWKNPNCDLTVPDEMNLIKSIAR
jgi:hypothetical protein